MPQKYITVNGVMQRNPAYVAPGKASVPASPALAIVSSLDDVMAASEVQSAATGVAVPMAESTAAAVEMLQDDELLRQYKSRTALEGGVILEELGRKFEQFEVPLGMVNKLLMLPDFKLDFLIDDSGSMSNPTDVDAADANEPMKTVIRALLKREPRAGEKMTRLQEAEDRLHTMIGFLAYIPVAYMQLRFLNDRRILVLDRSGKTPEEFEADAHKKIREHFNSLRLGSTPVLRALQTGFEQPGRWSHYFFNDGTPDEGGPAIVKQIIERKNPENHCLTLISCTNNDADTAWMKAVDQAEGTKYVAEIDDYADEKEEVSRKQGAAFPFSRGLWLLNHLAASFNPFDLDALDENLPLTRTTLSNILGRQLSPKEYHYYFEKNPNAALYVGEYVRFLNEPLFARQIIPSAVQAQRELTAGYVETMRPERPLPDISRSLDPITAIAQAIFSETYASRSDGLATTTSAATAGGGGGGGGGAGGPSVGVYTPTAPTARSFAAAASGYRAAGMTMFPIAPPPLASSSAGLPAAPPPLAAPPRR